MDKTYLPNDKDLELVTIFKREANIILASLLKNPTKYKVKKDIFDNVLTILYAIENTNNYDYYNIKNILEIINNIIEKGVLSPLRLTNDEFNEFPTDGKYRNIRCNSIYHVGNGHIYDEEAINIYIRATYNDETKLQVNLGHYNSIIPNVKLYINKGGVVIGDYIQQFEIRDIYVKEHYFIHTPITIPVSVIYYIDNEHISKELFTVDHREPTLIALKDKYDCMIFRDETIAAKRLDIRKYKKL